MTSSQRDARPDPELSKLYERGGELRDQYERSGDVAALDESIVVLQAALAKAAQGSDPHLYVLASLGLSLRTRYWRTGNPDDLARAIAFHEQAVTLTLPGSVLLPGMLSNLGGSLRLRYHLEGHPQDLERAVSAYRQAVDLTPQESPWLPTFLNNLANGLRARYLQTKNPVDLEESIQASKVAVAATETAIDDGLQPVGPDLVLHLANLAEGVHERYLRAGKVADIEAARKLYGRADIVGRWLRTSRNAPNQPTHTEELIKANADYYFRTGELEALNNAIAAADHILSGTAVSAPEAPAQLGNVARLLELRYERTGDRADLDRAIDLDRQAVESLPENSPRLARCLYRLYAALSRRFEDHRDPPDGSTALAVLEYANLVARAHEDEDKETGLLLLAEMGRTLVVAGNSENLDAAVEASKLASEGLPQRSSDQLRASLTLATALALRSQRRGRRDDWALASTAFRDCCRVSLEFFPALALEGARRWAKFAAELVDWHQAVEACQLALQATSRLFLAQALRRDRETWLRHAQGLPAEAAYALAQVGNLNEATLVVEQGQALLLSEVLERDRVDLQRLAAERHHDLYDRFQSAAGRVEALERDELGPRDSADQEAMALSSIHGDLLRQARKELAASIDEFQQVAERHIDPLDASRQAEIVAAASHGPLVYMLTTDHGGVALIVRSGTTTAIWLPELRTDSLREQLLAFFAAQEADDRAGVRQALDRLTHWIWNAAMAPLMEQLPSPEPVQLVPIGLLTLLPLHAAWTDDESSKHHRRYVLDQLTISYAPNARALRVARTRATARRADRLLAIGDPQPVTAPVLPHAAMEAENIRRFFSESRLLRDRDAKRDLVLSAMREHPVVHFACHGRSNTQNPLASALLLASDRPLELRDLLSDEFTNLRIAVLSACETAVPGLNLPDEVVSLPTGLLQAGAAGVVASLWPVADTSTMLLMLKFYDLWRKEGLEPAEALRQAQQWVRDATNGEKQDAYPDVTALMEPEGSVAMKTFWAGGRSHTHPYHWAAFTYVGA